MSGPVDVTDHEAHCCGGYDDKACQDWGELVAKRMLTDYCTPQFPLRVLEYALECFLGAVLVSQYMEPEVVFARAQRFAEVVRRMAEARKRETLKA